MLNTGVFVVFPFCLMLVPNWYSNSDRIEFLVYSAVKAGIYGTAATKNTSSSVGDPSSWSGESNVSVLRFEAYQSWYMLLWITIEELNEAHITTCQALTSTLSSQEIEMSNNIHCLEVISVETSNNRIRSTLKPLTRRNQQLHSGLSASRLSFLFASFVSWPTCPLRVSAMYVILG